MLGHTEDIFPLTEERFEGKHDEEKGAEPLNTDASAFDCKE